MGKIKSVIGLIAIMLLSGSALLRAQEQTGSLVSFRSGDTMLQGYVYKPSGHGPFPGVIFFRSTNKAIDEFSPPQQELAKYYTSMGFVFFVPCRRTNTDLNLEYTATTGQR